ncbi:hypothetical protein [Geobacter sp.]|uniref:hypothetical protein n=1 Tax=Geobacter sp. TaxID=46610 RepID=UPI002601B7D3|nr:hypothetical protein [Geobacter sp.]
MNATRQTRLTLTLPSSLIGDFFPILQQGFFVPAHVGGTLQHLLCHQWDISPDYVATRITTIFLNAKATDNVETALVRDRATIALSGAMPGLVGATMRRGGHLAAMRGAMTHHETPADAVDRLGTVRVKLFNILLPELGPAFLARGILVSCDELASFFRERDETFWKWCDSAILDNTPVSAGRLRAAEPFCPGGTVRLTVNFR